MVNINWKFTITFIVIFVVVIVFVKFFVPKHLFEYGVKYEKNGEINNALFCYDIAIFINNNLAKVHLQRGRMIYYNFYNSLSFDFKKKNSKLSYINNRYLKKKPKIKLICEMDFKKAIDIDPTDVNAHLYLGQLYINQDRYFEAYNCFNAALSFDKKNRHGYFGRAFSSDCLENYEAALIDYTFIIKNFDLNTPLLTYDLSIKLSAVDWKVFKFRAEIYIKMEKYQEAIADLDQAIKLEQDDHWLLFKRGSVKEKNGDYIGAIKDYDKIVEMDKAGSECYFARGKAKKEIGDLKGFEEDIRNGEKIEEEKRQFEINNEIDRIKKLRE